MTASVTSLATRLDTPGSWSPEECLIELLDSIRAGTCNPAQLVMIYAEPGMLPEYLIAGPGSAVHKIGMVQLFLHRYLHDVSDDACQPY